MTKWMTLVLASKLASKKPLPLVVSSCLFYFNHISQKGFNVQILLVYLHKITLTNLTHWSRRARPRSLPAFLLNIDHIRVNHIFADEVPPSNFISLERGSSCEGNPVWLMGFRPIVLKLQSKVHTHVTSASQWSLVTLQSSQNKTLPAERPFTSA